MIHPVVCYSTNAQIGSYIPAIRGIMIYLNDNPPKPNEKKLIDYIKDLCGATYPQIMRIITSQEFKYAHLIHMRAQRNI